MRLRKASGVPASGRSGVVDAAGLRARVAAKQCPLVVRARVAAGQRARACRYRPPQFCRSGGIGIGMLYVVAPTPTPPSHVLGGVVQIDRVPWHSAAQNM